MIETDQKLFLDLVERLAGIGCWYVDLHRQQIYWSDQIYAIHGVSPGDFSPSLDSFYDFCHPEDLERVKNCVEEAIEHKKNFEFECRLVRPDQSVCWVHTRGECVQNDIGEIIELYGISQDITARYAERARYELSVSAARAGVWDWDVKSSTFVSNDYFHKMLGEEPVSNPLPLDYFFDRLHPEDVAYAAQEIEKAHSDRNYEYKIEFRFRCIDGSYKWLRSSGQVVAYDALNRPLRMIGQHFDIDHQKKIEEQLRFALEEANSANRIKSEFLSNISHEIRTPLNGVLGMTDLLLDSNLDEEQEDLVKTLKRSGEALFRVINDILDFSSVEEGNIELIKTCFSLSEVICAVEGMYANLVIEKNVILSLCLMPDVPNMIYGDSERLLQVLIHLVGNALKFTGEGGSVTVSIVAEHLSSAETKISFYISDTGIGISDETQKNMFEAFSQADASLTRDFGGTGLGLAISAKLIELMGGKLDVTSTRGKGSTFYFSAIFGLPENC